MDGSIEYLGIDKWTCFQVIGKQSNSEAGRL